jgi:hypothetical protein
MTVYNRAEEIKIAMGVKRYTKLRKILIVVLIIMFFILGFFLGTQYTYYAMVSSLNYAFQDSNINIAIEFNETRLVQEINRYAQNQISGVG